MSTPERYADNGANAQRKTGLTPIIPSEEQMNVYNLCPYMASTMYNMHHRNTGSDDHMLSLTVAGAAPDQLPLHGGRVKHFSVGGALISVVSLELLERLGALHQGL